MGHQSYVCWYTSQQMRDIILKRIKEHNEAEFDKTDENGDYLVGEELHSICDAKSSKKMRDKGMIGAILCANGGGRSSTFPFLSSVCRCDGFEASTHRSLCVNTKWTNLNLKEEIESMQST